MPWNSDPFWVKKSPFPDPFDKKSFWGCFENMPTHFWTSCPGDWPPCQSSGAAYAGAPGGQSSFGSRKCPRGAISILLSLYQVEIHKKDTNEKTS